MNILGLVPVLLVTISAGVGQVTIVAGTEGYYWRDFKGDIPSDAVPGGVDKNGKTTYIGQALHISPPNGKLIPGTIDATTKKMYYAWGSSDNAYEVTINVKILCSQHPYQFQWTETDFPKVQSLPQENFVLGGYDTSYNLYIGRIRAEGQVVIGKVTLTNPYDFTGYAVNGKQYFSKTTFEILSFNPRKVNQVDSCASPHNGNIIINIVKANGYEII